MRVTTSIVMSALVALCATLSVQADSGFAEEGSSAGAIEAHTAPAASPQAETLHAFDQWAAQQEVYSRPMIVEMRERLSAAFASLPPGEAALYRDNFIAKLSILGDPQWQNGQQWLLETLAVASDSYAKTVLAMLPDIVGDSPGELRAKLRAISIRAMGLKQARQGFDEIRLATLQAVREDQRRQAQINNQVRASMTFSTPNLYSPTAHNGQPPYQRYSGYFNRRFGFPFSQWFGGVWFF